MRLYDPNRDLACRTIDRLHDEGYGSACLTIERLQAENEELRRQLESARECLRMTDTEAARRLAGELRDTKESLRASRTAADSMDQLNTALAEQLIEISDQRDRAVRRAMDIEAYLNRYAYSVQSYLAALDRLHSHQREIAKSDHWDAVTPAMWREAEQRRGDADDRLADLRAAAKANP